jgi:hypothetical protein
MRGLMASPGQVDQTYIDNLATTVEQCAAGGIFVLLDFHQDGYAPKYNGNGFPDWMAIDDGLPNPPEAVFPLYYIQNPAMQRAFEHFWADTPIPGGDGLHDYFVRRSRRLPIASATADGDRHRADERALAREEWRPCVFEPAGCPALEAERLMPFCTRAAAALRAIAPATRLRRPFVLFNFGQRRRRFRHGSGHRAVVYSYALDVNGEVNVVRFDAGPPGDDAPAVITEFGQHRSGAAQPSDRAVRGGTDAVDVLVV